MGVFFCVAYLVLGFGLGFSGLRFGCLGVWRVAWWFGLNLVVLNWVCCLCCYKTEIWAAWVLLILSGFLGLPEFSF